MKKLTLLPVAILFAMIAFAQQPKKNLTEVNQYSGVYVFIDCKPVAEFTYIATMKKMCVANSMIDAVQKYAAMAKKEYPDCDAIIFHDVYNSIYTKDVFDVVKLK